MTPELAVLAIAFLLSTSSNFVYLWLVNHGKRPNTGIWTLRMTAVFPGLLSTLWAIYTISIDAMATGNKRSLGMALLAAGILLVGNGVQLLSLLARKQRTPPDSQLNSGQ